VKKIADFFLFITAALAIPTTLKEATNGFYEKYPHQILWSSIGLGILLSVLNSAKIKENEKTLYWLKHKAFTTRNITIFILCTLVLSILTTFIFPFFNLALPTSSVVYSTSIAMVYVLFLLVTDRIPFSRLMHTLAHFDASHSKRSDFHGVGGGIWDEPTKKELLPYATGSFDFENDTLIIDRTNTGGRFKITVKNYPYERKNLAYIPVDSFQDSARTFEVTCEVRSVQGIKHTLAFAFADAVDHRWFQSSREDVASIEWRRIELTLTASHESKLKFRIDDLDVSAPSSVMIRGLKIIEKI